MQRLTPAQPKSETGAAVLHCSAVFERALAGPGSTISRSPAWNGWHARRRMLGAAEPRGRTADQHSPDEPSTIGASTYWQIRPGATSA